MVKVQLRIENELQTSRYEFAEADDTQLSAKGDWLTVRQAGRDVAAFPVRIIEAILYGAPPPTGELSIGGANRDANSTGFMPDPSVDFGLEPVTPVTALNQHLQPSTTGEE